MFNSRGEFGHLSVLRALVLVALTCVAAFCAEPAKESTTDAPRVTAILQITHDGISKASLVADGSDLFVTESPGSGHVVAKLSVKTAQREVMTAGFADALAMDISADRTKLLVVHQGAAG